MKHAMVLGAVLSLAACAGTEGEPAATGGGGMGGAGRGTDRIATSELRMALDGAPLKGDGAFVAFHQMGEIFNSVGGSFSQGTVTFAISWAGTRTGTLTP